MLTSWLLSLRHDKTFDNMSLKAPLASDYLVRFSMGKSAPKIATGVFVIASFCAAKAQSVTEYGSMASKSSTVGQRANSIGKEIGGVWGSLDKTIKSQDGGSSQGASPGRPAQHTPVRSRRKAPGSRAAAAIHEDPSRIQPGLAYEDVIRRFGPASFEVSTGPGTKTMAYPGKNGGIDVELLDGKVVKVATARTEEVAVVGPR